MNIGSILKAVVDLFIKPEVAKTLGDCAKTVAKSGHHRKAIADGLRRGSSEAAMVMARWRWK